MAKSIINRKRERQVIDTILTQQMAQQENKTQQLQGTAATRLAVIEGYLDFAVDLDNTENARFVEFTAPENATIILGSLVYSTYKLQYDPVFPSAFPIDI